MAKSKKEIISIQSVSKIYNLGETVVKALDNVSLSIYDNDYISIMGPSGSGKSTLMNIIGCLDVPTKGKYKFKDELISEMDDNQLANIRNEKIGFVFQTFNLLPKLNAMQNVEVPLIYSSLGRKERIERAEEALHIVGLQDRMTHKPNELSGGQRQRVAIGRAITRKPKLFLFDEPLSNLDASLRVEMRLELARLHQTLKTTMVYVTHDQVEAMTLADRIVVLESGQIAQIGTPKQLYEQPANLFVAQFVGSPKMNIFKNSAAESIVKNKEFLKLLNKNREAANIGVRPEHFILERSHKHGFFGRVSVVEYLGAVLFCIY